MRERDKRSETGSDTDTPSSSCSPSSSSSSPSPSISSDDSPRESYGARKHGSGKRKRSVSTNRGKGDSEPSSSSSESSDADVKRRKSRLTRGKDKRSNSHRRGRTDREKEKKRERRRRSSKGSDDKHGRKEKHRKKEKHDRERRKRKVPEVESVVVVKEDVPLVQFGAKSTLQAVNEAQLKQKEIVRRNVELAKARLASGELQKMKHDQMEMQRLYGTVDWREKKKLRAEKSRLERTIAAGKKLASIEERESARMDAFRVADCQQPKHSVRRSGEQKQHEHWQRQKLSIRIACHHLLVVECHPDLVRLLGHDYRTRIFVNSKVFFCSLIPPIISSFSKANVGLHSSCILQRNPRMWLQVSLPVFTMIYQSFAFEFSRRLTP